MAPELAAKFPEIKTYEVYGEDDPAAFGRLSITPFGFHGLISKAEGSVWIDPYQAGDTEHYIVYHASDYRRAEGLSIRPCSGTQETPEVGESTAWCASMKPAVETLRAISSAPTVVRSPRPASTRCSTAERSLWDWPRSWSRSTASTRSTSWASPFSWSSSRTTT
ncbi:MAG: hypothetical protein R3E12_07140 [Candidatus Eisenbacteria bacterium]